MQNYTVITSFS